MTDLLILLWIFTAFVCMAFWEAYVEGKYPWAQRQVGWKIKLTEHSTLTAYHFWLNLMLFFFTTLPLIVYGWSTHLVGVLLVGWFLGFVIEDLLWFVINPYYSLQKFNPRDANWYPWFGPLPVLYYVGIVGALLSWIFLW